MHAKYFFPKKNTKPEKQHKNLAIYSNRHLAVVITLDNGGL